MTAIAEAVPHTRGQWKVGKDGTNVTDANGFGLAQAEEMLVLSGWDRVRRQGKRVQHWSRLPGVTYREIPVEEAEANARLIAAAPDLLAALEDVTDRLGFAEWSGPEAAESLLVQIIERCHGAARAAIAKAKGSAA